MKVRVKVEYDAKNVESGVVDSEIRKLMESIGAELYAEGKDLTTGVRDICFDLPILEE